MRDNIVRFSEAEEESGLARVKKETRRMRVGRLYRILLLILLAAGVLLAYLIYEKTKVYTNYSVKSSIQRAEVSGVTLKNFNGSILSYSKDGAGAIDATGKLLWNQTFDMQNPMISMCGDTVAFADYGGSTIYVQKSNGETGKIATDKPIRKIATSSGNYVVAVLDDIDVTWIYMYDLNGKEISYFRSTMEKSGYPLDIDVSPTGELVCISYYFLDCDETKSSVAFYNFGSVGQNQIDNCVSGYNYTDVMVPYVQFLNEETAIAVSNEKFCIYGGSHIPVSVMEQFVHDEILSVYTSEDAIGIVFKNDSSEGKYRLELYDASGNLMSQKIFDFDYSDVSFGGGRVILYGDTHLYIASYNGDIKFDGEYTDSIILVIPTLNASEYTIVTKDAYDTIKLD